MRHLSSNWRLILAPSAALDYVVHELAHLIDPSHSTKFWLQVRSHCPDFQHQRAWLASHREELHRLPSLASRPV